MDILRVAKSRASSRFGLRADGGFRSQVGEGRVTALGNYNFGGVGFSRYGKGTVNNAQKHYPNRSTRGPCCISAD
jgi:hypothetical protein